MADDIRRPFVPPGHLEANTVFGFLVGDFASVWDALVRGTKPPGSGANFALGLMAGILLELCCRIASSSSDAYAHFSERLGQHDPRYYCELPFSVSVPRGFKLPAGPNASPDRQLLAAIFGLLRHGQAHQYHQMVATLSDGKLFGIQLTGAEWKSKPPVYESLMQGSHTRPADHLALDVKAETGNIWLRVRPEVLFKDIERAARMSSLFSGILQLKYLRPPALDATAESVLTALAPAQFPRLPLPTALAQSE
jgi:hypothetical protein